MDVKTRHIVMGLFCLFLFFPRPASEAKAETEKTYVTIATDDLNVRSGPGLHYSIITTVDKGETYPLMQKEEDWIQIQLQNNEKGWVADYLVTVSQNEQDSPSSLPKEKKKQTARLGMITANSVNVRSSPSLSADIIGMMNAGITVEILAKEKDWIQIKFGEGTGWISAQYMDEARKENKDREHLATVNILHDGTNIRKGPSTQAVILERANKGDTYEAVQFIGDWYEIKLSNGESGYVASWVVSAIDNSQRKNSDKTSAQTGLKDKTIVLDPGHGGEDGGTVGAHGTLEKRLTFEMAKQLKAKLEEAGANVLLTRMSDYYLPLTTRITTADFRHVDAFISLHFDHSKDDTVQGLTTYFYHPWQKELAVELHSSVIKQTNQHDRGVRFGDYYVIRENKNKAVLIEFGYLSNPEEERIVRTNEYLNLAATGIYEGLGRYFNQ